jgi:hypothetical protein
MCYAETPSPCRKVKCVYHPDKNKMNKIWINERSEFGEANHEVH